MKYDRFWIVWTNFLCIVKPVLVYNALSFSSLVSAIISGMDTTDEGYAGKRGDFAFCDKDFKTAIQCYSQVLFCYRIKDET